MKLNDNGRVFDRTLTALGHPIRRAILERLMQREMRVTELAEPFAMSLTAVSKHVSVLERAGLLKRRRVWREHLLSFEPRPLAQVSAWIETAREFWNARLDALDALLGSEDAATTPQPTKKKGKAK